MSQPSLKLVTTTSAAETDPLRFEQRGAERHHVTGRATAVLQSTDPNGPINRIRSIQLVNLSDSGLGAVCQDSFEPGTTIAVFLPPHGPDRGMDVYGQVVRCTPKDYGHEIGIRFVNRAAA